MSAEREREAMLEQVATIGFRDDGLPDMLHVKASWVTTPAQVFAIAHAIPPTDDYNLRRFARRIAIAPVRFAHDFEAFDDLPDRGWYIITHIPTAGQELTTPTHNLRLVFEPQFRGKGVLVLEVGCDHDYNVTSPYNAFHKYLCTKCGYAWAVDSSG